MKRKDQPDAISHYNLHCLTCDDYYYGEYEDSIDCKQYKYYNGKRLNVCPTCGETNFIKIQKEVKK